MCIVIYKRTSRCVVAGVFGERVLLVLKQPHCLPQNSSDRVFVKKKNIIRCLTIQVM